MFPSFSFFIIVYPIILCMKYIYAVCFLLLVCGCHKENDTPVVLPARTLLVYLGGDNNLDAETYDKLVQIKMDGKTGQMEI